MKRGRQRSWEDINLKKELRSWPKRLYHVGELNDLANSGVKSRV